MVKFLLMHGGTDRVAKPGDEIVDFRGDKAILSGWPKDGGPKHLGGRNRVWTEDGGEFYPSVFNLEWRDEALHNEYTAWAEALAADFTIEESELEKFNYLYWVCAIKAKQEMQK